MNWTQTLIPTLKENPQEAQIKSHRLMLRAGLIRKLASGTYMYLPLGLRALQKAAEVVREEMNQAGAVEVLLPAIHPAELWKESGRFEILGEDMIHFKDRHGKENVLGPTHEEVITDLARREIRSYKQLPITLYQIQTKFRDEIRPRSGVIRSREFLMKDAYSFHDSDESLDATYQLMKETYKNIFQRCGLNFYIVQADPGAMGGSGSQEFVLFSDAGEDWMVQFGDSDQVVSVEMAERKLKGVSLPTKEPTTKYKKINTPGHSSVEAVVKALGKNSSDLVKTIIYEVGSNSPELGGCDVFAVLVRGDHEVSDYKVKKIHKDAKLASHGTIERVRSTFGFSGPYELRMNMYIDEDVLLMKDFVVGANEKDYHLINFSVEHIVQGAKTTNAQLRVGDYRQVVEDDVAPDGKTPLKFKTAIELGHVFKLNKRYSDRLGAIFVDKDGKEKSLIMGCYGIGVNRILAAAIEQCADDKGIVWPRAISPYQVLIILIDIQDPQSRQIVETIVGAEELKNRRVDVLIDDRAESAGVKFNDADLIGIPLRVILGPKNLKNGKVEIKLRKTLESFLVNTQALVPSLLKHLDKLT